VCGPRQALGIGDYALTVANAATSSPFERVVVVGHSLAGITIPLVARRLGDQVAHLVFLSSVVPPEGSNVVDTIPRALQAYARSQIRRHDDFRISSELARHLFCNDASRAQFEDVKRQLCPEPTEVLTERVSRKGVPPDVPTTYIMCFRDRALTPRRQRRQIANLGRPTQVLGLDSDHDAFASAPRELALLLNALADTAAKTGVHTSGGPLLR
jgi:pimeloyl-ACP methyl ester carboxylesterase